MKRKQHLNLSDLISLEGLTKPGEGEITFELGSKKLKKLHKDMTNFTVKMEDHKDVIARELASLVASMKQALSHELSPEKTAEILSTLKNRFFKKDKFYKTVTKMNWEEIQVRLEANPEKLWSLNEMERTGGEPDVLGVDPKTGEYVFIDCSAESPAGRRNSVYDREDEVNLNMRNPSADYKGNAVSMATLMGVNLLSEDEYREFQTLGGFDKNSSNWLITPLDTRALGVTLYGYRDNTNIRVNGNLVPNHLKDRGFRSWLRF